MWEGTLQRSNFEWKRLIQLDEGEGEETVVGGECVGVRVVMNGLRLWNKWNETVDFKNTICMWVNSCWLSRFYIPKFVPVQICQTQIEASICILIITFLKVERKRECVCVRGKKVKLKILSFVMKSWTCHSCHFWPTTPPLSNRVLFCTSHYLLHVLLWSFIFVSTLHLFDMFHHSHQPSKWKMCWFYIQNILFLIMLFIIIQRFFFFVLGFLSDSNRTADICLTLKNHLIDVWNESNIGHSILIKRSKRSQFIRMIFEFNTRSSFEKSLCIWHNWYLLNLVAEKRTYKSAESKSK